MYATNSIVKQYNERKVQTISDHLMSKAVDIFIFSVNPRPIIMQMGSMGTYTILPREEGQRVSKPLSVKDIIPNMMDMGDGKGTMMPSYQDGNKFAQELVHGGPSGIKDCNAYTVNNEWKGVFISESSEPTDAEISLAESKYSQFLDSIIAEADKLWQEGPLSQKLISAFHREACQTRKQKRPWFTINQDMIDCPICMAPVRPEAKKCLSCGEWIDGRQAETQAPAKHPARGAKA